MRVSIVEESCKSVTVCLSPEAEALRLDALHRLNLLDTSPSESFDRITRMATRLFNLPIAAVSLTDVDRQWFKSRIGVEHWSIPREGAPCASVAESGEVLVLPDLLADPIYSDTILSRQGVRFYAGAPLITRDGHGLGALCVLGTEPRKISEDELAGLRDLAAMVMAQIELQHALGRVDPVSGLPNRTQFLEDLEDAARECGGERRLAVLVDLAPSERINDGLRVLGPRFFDDMLAQAIPMLRHALRPSTVYHISAHQFAALLPDFASAEERDTLFQARLAEAKSSSTYHFIAAAAVGAMPLKLGRRSAANVLRSVHAAALDARAARTSIAIHSQMNDAAHRRRFDLLGDFEQALATDDQLRLVLQPRYDLHSGKQVGCEALLRWRHPELGDVSPAEFVPIMEHSALARPMTQWVLQRATDVLQRLQKAGYTGYVSVNLSAANLLEDDLATRLGILLDDCGIDPHLIELEVTESAAIGDREQGTARLHELASLGVSLAIDDFGTGHSSLSYLKELPASTVKIDRSFIEDIGEERGRVLLGSTVGLLRELGYRVVAEGIETALQADLLRAMLCHEGPGYHLGRPVEIPEFTAKHAIQAAEAKARALC